MPILLFLLFALFAPAQDLHQKDQYKKQNRDVVTRVAKGDAKAGLKYADKYLKKWPADLEADYIAVLAHAKLLQYEQAIAVIQRSLVKGMPFTRYQAGPRTLLSGLYATDAYKALAEKHGRPLLHGPLLGAVTANSANIWLRTPQASPITIHIGDQRFHASTRAATDFTAVVPIAGLQPATAYDYSIQVGDSHLPKTYSFRSAPATGKPAKLRIGFGGGAGYTPWLEHMWTTIADAKLQAFLLLGDNVYIDTPEVRETQRYCYYRRQSQPAFRHFAATTSVHAIWDDHDFGGNDCTSALSLDSPPWKRDVLEVFTQNWANPSYGQPDAPGIWHRFALADIDFFMLDCRFYRQHPKKIDSPSMLGPAQLAWLKRELRNSKATFKVICSAVPMTPGTKGSSPDTWDGFPAEREAIFRHIADARIDGVFILAADRHRSDAWRIKRPDSYPLYEFMSSRLTNIHSHRLLTDNPACLFAYGPNAYGRLVFDTSLADPEASYEIVDIAGKVAHRHTLKRSELRNP
jgi:alkaline phosphatase D